MKKLRFIAVTTMLLSIFGSSKLYAQFFDNSGWASAFNDKNFGWSSAFDDNSSISNSYSVFSIGYEEMYFDNEKATSTPIKGFNLQLTNSTALFSCRYVSIDWGLRAYMGFWGDTDYKYNYDNDHKTEIKTRITTLNVSVPLSIGFHIPLGKNTFIAPYGGVYAKANLLGKGSEFVDGKKEESWDLFSKKDMGYYDWERFLFGWHAGGRAELHDFVITFEYGKQFNDLCDECGSHHIMLSFGVKI